MAAVYAWRYDEAARRDVMVACAGSKEEPPFVAEFLEEIRGPIEVDENPRLSSITDLQVWAARAGGEYTSE